MKPFIYVHELIENSGAIWLGCPDENVVRQSYTEGETGEEVIALVKLSEVEARIEELENALQELYLASGPVANCAYNVGQRHEDWENIKQYIDKLDSARLVAVNVFKENKQ